MGGLSGMMGSIETQNSSSSSSWPAPAIAPRLLRLSSWKHAAGPESSRRRSAAEKALLPTKAAAPAAVTKTLLTASSGGRSVGDRAGCGSSSTRRRTAATCRRARLLALRRRVGRRDPAAVGEATLRRFVCVGLRHFLRNSERRDGSGETDEEHGQEPSGAHFAVRQASQKVQRCFNKPDLDPRSASGAQACAARVYDQKQSRRMLLAQMRDHAAV